MTEPTTRTHDPSARRPLAFGWLLLPISLFPLAALVSYDWHAVAALNLPPAPSANWIGALGDLFAFWGYKLVGLAVWIVPFYCLIVGLNGAFGQEPRRGLKHLWMLVFVCAAACLIQPLNGTPGMEALRAKVNTESCGGVVGYLLMSRALVPSLGAVGAVVLVSLLAAVALVGAIGPLAILNALRACWNWCTADRPRPSAAAEIPAASGDANPYDFILQAKEDARREREAERARIREEKAAEKEAKRAAKEAAKEAERAAREAAAAARNAPAPLTVSRPAVPAAVSAPVAAEEAPAADKGPYLLPPVSLLNPLSRSTADHGDVNEMSQRIINTLKIFNVDATMCGTIQGPVVTKYKIQLAVGTRYSAVTNLTTDLKGALMAKSLRIEAPIPGDSAVGIEVPNRTPAGISFREIFESEAWRNSKAELPLLFGKRADGRELVADLASMPHMLVAGATGQGKSVCLNSLICGLLMTRTPDELKLIMVDPKCVEFTPYAAIPHLLVPVITDNRKVVFSLHWAVAEMEKRLKLFARAKVRNIYDFNHRKMLTQTDMFGNDERLDADMPRTVPYIVIIIDEAADLIGQCGKEVNPDIQRITQKARAAGIHLILATQRPDAKIITGTIKANIPGRVAFKTSQAIDSRTILDEAGAENLIGRGDMLFRGKDNVLVRAQGAWISDDEIARVTQFIGEHADTQFDETFATKLGRVKEAAIADPFADNEDDPDNNQDAATENRQAVREQVKAAADADDFKKAVECIINTRRASTSHFQRQMGWGYNHAAKILDRLTERGIVSAPQGMGPRQIVMDQDQLLAILNENTSASASAEQIAGADDGTPEPTGEEDAPFATPEENNL